MCPKVKGIIHIVFAKLSQSQKHKLQLLQIDSQISFINEKILVTYFAGICEEF